MSIQSDRWIREQALQHKMIEPFSEKQVCQGVISYGLSSYGYRSGRRSFQGRRRSWGWAQRPGRGSGGSAWPGRIGVPADVGADVQDGVPVLDQAEDHVRIRLFVILEIQDFDGGDALVVAVAEDADAVFPRGHGHLPVADFDPGDVGGTKAVGILEKAVARLSGAIAAAQERCGSLAVLYLDLDNFKRVNDTLGHAVGDELLNVVASRLRATLRDGDGDGAGRRGDLARLGGDEFLVLLPSIKDADDAGAVATRVIQALREPVTLGSASLVVTPSVGIALYPRDGADAETLMRNADLAMYFAKRKTAGSHAYFQGSMNAAALQRFTIEERLRDALERNEFSLEYQPQFDVRTGGISGMEALLRWKSAALGSVPPVEFIPVADDTGLILPIGDWVLRTACAQAKLWHDEGLPCGRMAVNVSGKQFGQADFPQKVATIVRDSGLDPRLLELEITESVVMADESWTEKALAQLKGLGITIAIDDFGMGYSSFGRLRHYEVDRLKIDRSFVTSINERSDDRAIAAAIITMSRALHISVTAEGVESLAQLMFLQEHECQDAQGYLLSKALSVHDAHALLRRVAEVADGSRSQRLKAIIG